MDEIRSVESLQLALTPLKLPQITFLMQISLEKVDLVLFTR